MEAKSPHGWVDASDFASEKKECRCFHFGKRKKARDGSARRDNFVTYKKGTAKPVKTCHFTRAARC